MLPRIQDLPPDDRRAAYAEAGERVRVASREMVAETKARKPDPRSAHDYRAYNTMRMVCVLVVKRREPTATSVECTRGASEARIYLPMSRLIAQVESTEDFLLAVIPKWLAEKASLMGVTPELAGDWTDAQRETWKSLSNLRFGINSKIHFANKRPAPVISRSATA